MRGPASRPTNRLRARRTWRRGSSAGSRPGRTGSSSGPTPPARTVPCDVSARVAKASTTASGSDMAPAFNAATWLVDRHVEEGRGDRTAVRGSSRTLTYAELAQLSGDVASSLRQLGLRRDDRVVFLMSDDVELLSAMLGAFRAGVVAVPVSTMLAAHEVGKIIADSGARVVFATHEYVEAVSAAIDLAPEVEHFVLAGADALPVLSAVPARSWDDFIALGRGGTNQDRTVAATDEDAWALWLYTSGTTGSPKGAMHRHANIRHVCQTYGDQVLGITAQDSCFSIAKLFFAYGIGNSAFFPLSVGSSTAGAGRRGSSTVVAPTDRGKNAELPMP